jgi:hypothetical protein
VGHREAATELGRDDLLAEEVGERPERCHRGGQADDRLFDEADLERRSSLVTD